MTSGPDRDGAMRLQAGLFAGAVIVAGLAILAVAQWLQSSGVG